MARAQPTAWRMDRTWATLRRSMNTLQKACELLLVVGSIALGAGACSSESSGGDPSSPAVSTSIGPEGGEVKAGAALVTVPKGALTSTVTISISPVTTGYPALTSGMTPRGDVLAFLPHGQAFELPVTIQVPFTGVADTSKVKLFTAQPGGTWSEVSGATVSGSTLQAQVDHFSFFLSAEGSSLVNAGGCIDPPNDEGSFLCIETYYGPEQAQVMKPGLESNCTKGGGTFANACPANANPGCCTQGPANGYMHVTCYYNCVAEVCAGAKDTCAASNGVWGSR